MTIDFFGCGATKGLRRPSCDALATIRAVDLHAKGREAMQSAMRENAVKTSLRRGVAAAAISLYG